jgi:hypothetical protein
MLRSEAAGMLVAPRLGVLAQSVPTLSPANDFRSTNRGAPAAVFFSSRLRHAYAQASA